MYYTIIFVFIVLFRSRFKYIESAYTSPGRNMMLRQNVFSRLHHANGAINFCGEHVPGGDHYEIGTINGAMESAQCAVQRWYPSLISTKFLKMSSKI
mgnify:CR=1 FL=1